MRGICRICGRKITRNRTSHLKREHGIQPYKGCVRDYFDTPEEHNITAEEWERIGEGELVFTTISVVGKVDKEGQFKPWFSKAEKGAL
ncbi:MAG TPA: hypothetical protein ENG32_01930 [bacterium]|nr:hypothetical protein [bacterium]